MLLLCALVVGSVNGWAEVGDVLAKLYNTGGSSYSTRMTKTDDYNVSWVLSGSYSGVWGSNSGQKANIKPTAADLPVVKGVTSNATTSTTYHYFYYATTAVSNVGSVEFSFDNTYDTSTSCNVYIVMGDAVSASGGEAYTQVELASTSATSQGASISAAGTYTFTFATTQTSAKYYGLVIKVANNSYKRLSSASLTLKEGATQDEGATASPTINGETTFYTNRTVTITNAESAEGAAIYYTLDGSIPTTATSETCFAYTKPFVISSTTTVTAIAKHANDEKASAPTSKTFTKATVLDGISGLNSTMTTTATDYNVSLIDAQVTWVSNTIGYMEDATAGIYIYNLELTKNKVYNGIFKINARKYNGMPQIASITAIEGETATITDGSDKAPTVMTASVLDADFTANLGRQIQINSVTVPNSGLALTENINLYGSSPYTSVSNGSTYNLVGYPFIGSSSSKTFRITSATELTITAEANDEALGTVSISGNVITATPAAGYHVSTSNPYTVNPTGSATVVQEDNTFTVTPTENTTITINFEANPSHTLSYTVSPTEAGTVDLGATSVKEGAATTATASANAGYKFIGWSISGTGASLSSETDNPTTVTMGTADATITASFEAVETNPIHWSVNGTVVKTDHVEANTAITFPTEIEGIPAGYTLKGWVVEANKIDTPTNTDPKANYVTSANSTEEITYYAVMAITKGTQGSASLTNDEITSNITNTACTYGTEKTYNDDVEGVTWVASVHTDAANRPWMQMKKDDETAYIKITAPGTITEIKTTITSANNSSGGIADITKHTAFSGTLCVETAATSNPSGSRGSSNTISNNIITINPTGTENLLFIQVSGGAARVWSMEITYDASTSTNFCTTVSSEPKVISVDSKGYTTLCANVPLDFTNATSKAYKATVEGNTVKMTKVTKVPAGEGIVIKGEAENIPVLSGDADDMSDNELVGVLVATTVEANTVSVLSTVNDVEGFYKFSGTTIPAGKAYLPVVASDGARMSIAFDEESGTTGVEEFKNSGTEELKSYYNLAGQRVAQPTKGLYIVNGKMVLVK